MIIYLVRHGATDWNTEGRCQGFSDIALNEEGKRQAKQARGALPVERIGAVYSSDLSRAVHTAELIAPEWAGRIRKREGLREMNQGSLEGLRFEDLARDHGELLKEWRRDPAGVVMPGGESLAQVQERAWRTIGEIREEAATGQVLVTSHNLTICTIICCVLGLDLALFRRFKQDPGAINVLEFSEARQRVLCLNNISHMGLLACD